MDTKLMQDTLNLFHLFQNVVLQTHKAGNILDCILTMNDSHKENLISDISNEDSFSDHYIIKFKTVLPRPPIERITITHRNHNKIDLDTFKIDLTAKLNTINNPDNCKNYIMEICKQLNPP